MFRDRQLTDYMSLLKRLMSLLEAGTIVLSAVLAHFIVSYFRDGAIWWPWPSGYDMMVTVSGLLTLFVFNDFGLYKGWRGQTFAHELRRITLAWVVVFLCLIVVAAATKTSAIFSRYWAGTWFFTSLFMLWGGRYLVSRFLHWTRSHGRDRKRIVIVGAGTSAQAVARELSHNPWAGYEVEGYFGCAEDNAVPGAPRVRHLGDYEDIANYLKDSGCKEVWIALSNKEHQVFRQTVKTLSDLTVDVCYVPDLFDMKLLNASLSHVVGIPVVNLSTSPMAGVNSFVKNLEDKVLASIALLLVSPLMLLIAIAIKLESPGPVIFKQKRHGWHGETFDVYKFRTMHLHDQPDGEVIQASVNDSRVYPLGRFLRRTSLDELPQFINVLQGGMSIVGPRPHAVEHNNEYRQRINNYSWRHKVKPGITGWAQINGFRGETSRLEDMSSRVEYDLYYIENWSLWFDIRIMLLTVIRGWGGSKAY